MLRAPCFTHSTAGHLEWRPIAALAFAFGLLRSAPKRKKEPCDFVSMQLCQSTYYLGSNAGFPAVFRGNSTDSVGNKSLDERKLLLRKFNLDSIFFAHTDLKSNTREQLYTRSCVTRSRWKT